MGSLLPISGTPWSHGVAVQIPISLLCPFVRFFKYIVSETPKNFLHYEHKSVLVAEIKVRPNVGAQKNVFKVYQKIDPTQPSIRIKGSKVLRSYRTWLIESGTWKISKERTGRRGGGGVKEDKRG